MAGSSDYYDTIDQKMGYTTKDEARAEMAGLVAANPTVAFVDLTD